MERLDRGDSHGLASRYADACHHRQGHTGKGEAEAEEEAGLLEICASVPGIEFGVCQQVVRGEGQRGNGHKEAHSLGYEAGEHLPVGGAGSLC